jgi:hypothetical protein
VGLRGKLRRLERGAREDLASFILEDGSRYYYNPESGELSIKALTRARNRAAALEATCGGGFGLFPYEREALIERGELVPVSWIHPIEDMSE